VTEIKAGRGRILFGDNLDVLLSSTLIRKESMVDKGIEFIRKKESGNRTLYFIGNRNRDAFEGWLPIRVNAASAVLYDPMTGSSGKAKVRKDKMGCLEVFVQLTTRQTIFIETYDDENQLPSFNNYTLSQTQISLSGKWKINFTSGGPELPAMAERDSLSSWTTFGGPVNQAFSGTATYSLSFTKPRQTARGWLLDLGKVKESAEVLLNGKSVGTLIGPVYQIYIDHSMLQENNTLEVKVSNLMANRISDMDRRKIFWKKFYNVNFPARKAENRKNGLFDASHWPVKDSGLLGPVTLTMVKTN
jgi:hypothetical protein